VSSKWQPTKPSFLYIDFNKFFCVHLGIQIEDARNTLHSQFELLESHGYAISRDRKCTEGLKAQINALKTANQDLTERLKDSLSMIDNLSDQLKDSETSIEALERKMANVLSALQQLLVAPNARV
jgi:septal ring factor EnvC (AmiA/AmiB activator)